ncbi:hypothetical protein BO99DRAFT_439367 [Aspergillus violaceofuscus CBS 115571]|uniref:Uncharacterized protein n=1 Tax=Aspergillus violaceofuscus (strain CBS 115571) TaxID=1450538 RepID=A0A2V5I690_ASPV1|nr:hypothetical protein BO99DRAFT_439367 [Aspergillus violaceofuscus CBS 115571]
MEANDNTREHSTPTPSSRVSSFLSLKKSQSSTNQPAPAATPSQPPSQQNPPPARPRALFTSAQEETADLLKTIHHARTQLREVQRLYHLKAAWLDATETRWIEATMADLDDAVRAAALLVEPARVEQETRRRGSIGLATQLRWVCRDSRRARLQRSRLLMCHQSLMVVFERLRGVYGPDGGGARKQELEQAVMELPAGEVVRPQDLSAAVGGLATQGEREEGVGGGNGGLEEELLDLLRWRQSKGNTAAVSREEEVMTDGGV